MFNLSNREMEAMFERERDYEACGRYSEYEEGLLESGNYMRDDYGCIIETTSWDTQYEEMRLAHEEMIAEMTPEERVAYDKQQQEKLDNWELPF